MSPTTLQPSYADVNAALISTGSAFQAADAHGLLCGIICATSGRVDSWEKLLLGPTDNAHGIEVLHELYESSYHQMSEFSFEFSLLLPSDDEDINWRTEALGLWCQGFLTGLEQAETPVQQHASLEVTDALNDIIEIAQVSYGDIPGSDEDETAYYELEEYVRLIALMLFHELKASPDDIPNESISNNDFDDDDIMH
jgi:uncharacterized protein YgfB (UPF0149 family)